MPDRPARSGHGVMGQWIQLALVVGLLGTSCSKPPLNTDAEPSTDAELRAHAKDDPQALNRLGWQKIQARGEERDIDQGIAMIRAAAEAGYAKAIYNLALIEQEGQWVEKDLDAAFDGMMRASRMGLIEAKAALGFMYERGLGVPPDPDEALYWYEEAATYGKASPRSKAHYTKNLLPHRQEQYLHGDRDAQFMLGRMSETGTPSVPMDAEQALLWYEDAAVRGDAASEHQIAVMLGIHGVPRVDRVSAYAWARLATTHSSVKEYDQTLQTIETALLPTERSRAESYFDTLADLVAYNLQDLRLDPQ